MPESLVLDTNILIYAARGDSQVAIDCLHIITNLKKNDSLQIAVDNEGYILEEYKANLKSRKNPLSNTIEEFIKSEVYKSQGQRSIVSCIPIRAREVEELLEMGFHDDDLIFARIAPRTDLEIVVSEDTRSFLEDEYRNWLNENLDIIIKDADGMCEFIESSL